MVSPELHAVPVVSVQETWAATAVRAELGFVIKGINNNKVAGLGFEVMTRDSSGALADGYFSFLAMIEEPDIQATRKGAEASGAAPSGEVCTTDNKTAAKKCVWDMRKSQVDHVERLKEKPSKE